MWHIYEVRNLLTIVKGRLRCIDRPPITWIPHRSWLSMAREMIETISSFSKACYTSPLKHHLCPIGYRPRDLASRGYFARSSVTVVGKLCFTLSKSSSSDSSSSSFVTDASNLGKVLRASFTYYVRTYLFSKGTI